MQEHQHASKIQRSVENIKWGDEEEKKVETLPALRVSYTTGLTDPNPRRYKDAFIIGPVRCRETGDKWRGGK